MQTFAGRLFLEVNPDHAVIAKLLERVKADTEDLVATETAKLLYETALLLCGFSPSSSHTFVSQV
jgi:HSP90 family molecular chaperone